MFDLLYYERHLPHRLPPGEIIFVTFRLARTLPLQVIGQLQEEMNLLRQRPNLLPAERYAAQKRYFGRFDHLLAQAGHGPTWLRLPQVAEVVAQSLHYFHGTHYDLLSYCLMPNHVHAVVRLPPRRRRCSAPCSA